MRKPQLQKEFQTHNTPRKKSSPRKAKIGITHVRKWSFENLQQSVQIVELFVEQAALKETINALMAENNDYAKDLRLFYGRYFVKCGS